MRRVPKSVSVKTKNKTNKNSYYINMLITRECRKISGLSKTQSMRNNGIEGQSFLFKICLFVGVYSAHRGQRRAWDTQELRVRGVCELHNM